jgi:isopentenyl-diphosphate delta-isomerase
MTTSSRKLDHIRICLEQQVESPSFFGDLVLVHKALPEIDARDIDTSCLFLGKKVKAPLMISAMTGGHPDTKDINTNLAIAAQEMGVAVAVGSQRAALEDPSLEDTFSTVREHAPDVPVIGNIGAVQIRQSGNQGIEHLREMIDADAVAVHLNFLQESIQPEGERDASGVLKAIRSVSSGPIPIIVKETGAGISYEDASLLVRAGVGIIDVAGVGGTSWSGVESYRAEARGDEQSREMGRLFWSWGIPTPVSVVECSASGAEVIASGGVRSGMDVARSLALGAKMAGVALPLLGPAKRSSEEVVKTIQSYLRGLRISMHLSGCSNLQELRGAPILVLGRTREMLEQRGFDTKKYAVRREMSR